MIYTVWKVALGLHVVSCDLVSHKAALNWANDFMKSGELPTYLTIYQETRNPRCFLMDVDLNGKHIIVETASYK